MDKLEIEKANKLYDEGKPDELYKLIKSYIENRDSYALYLYSSISLSEWNESGEQFDERRISLLHESSDGGVGDASYQLACCYLYGEGVEMNRDKAELYVDRAVALGHVSAKLLNENLKGAG